MIKVLYFARYRELLGLDSEQIEQGDMTTLEDLRRYLIDRGGDWLVLGEKTLMCARNEELCSLDEPLEEGDEIAFFPTVTGG